MGSPTRPAVYTIPAHRGFADALVAYLVERYAKGDRGLADGILLIPNNRAGRAITEAFVRRSEGGLLLPRMAAIGDLDLDESLGNALALFGEDDAIPSAIDPLRRQMMLAQLIAKDMAGQGEPIGAGEALRIATDFARAFDQLTFQDLGLADVARIGEGLAAEMSGHWTRGFSRFLTIAKSWTNGLLAEARIDAADRRNRLLARVAAKWKAAPPPGFVVAAGITTSAPAIARLLGVVARLPEGMVVFPHFDSSLDANTWSLIFPSRDAEDLRERPLEGHPQHHLLALLDEMAVAPHEVLLWPRLGDSASPSNRARVIGTAFAPASQTASWIHLPSRDRRLAGVRLMEAATSGEEALAIAILVREALETDGRRVAIVTPDRELARRVSAALDRWSIVADDSAGEALSSTPPGTLLLALAKAAAADFAPVELLALLKHPLVKQGEHRAVWLSGVRSLDLALRGPRPAPGLAIIDAIVVKAVAREDDTALAAMWGAARPILTSFNVFDPILAKGLPAILEAADTLSDGSVWRGEAGRALSALLETVQESAVVAPKLADADDLVEVLRTLLSAVEVRPSYGGHPRVAIYGLLEARLQQADLVICAGLNEGTWPGHPSPDPWLAPAIRKQLGLPSLERSIGLAAHDLAGALGAPEVVLTRARRERGGPATPSRFLLRLRALAGENMTIETRALDLARDLNAPRSFTPAKRPRPRPPAEARRVGISVTDFDHMMADPYAFYAKAILRLRPLDPLDAQPGPAWRGSLVHKVLERWALEDGSRPDLLLPRADAMLRDLAAHPLLRTLWRDRLRAGFTWLADRSLALAQEGRRPIAIERKGRIDFSGVELTGKADRIDRDAQGNLIIVDHKTGKAPSAKQVAAGFSLQLGLLGLLAERGAIEGVSGTVTGFEYWSLAKGKEKTFGQASSPVSGKNPLIAPDAFVSTAAAMASAAIDRWIMGAEPFTAKLHPAYAPYTDYDQLMRHQEWFGRPEANA